MKIALLDDHKLVRDGFKKLIELIDDWEVVAEVDCYDSAQMVMKGLDVDIFVIDISLGSKSGIEFVRFISKAYPTVKPLVVSMYDSNPYVQDALDAGAWGYVSKRSASDELLDAINELIKNKRYLSQDIIEKLHYQPPQTDKKISLLTARELEAFPLFSKGFSAKEVASSLNIMPKTAHVHRSNIYKKLNVKNQFELLKIALNEGHIRLHELT
ncbi:response regulator transcription factor [Psychrobium sp. 1_MG-2023]|uniref:response regulator transcription factor n=1 Tax=Psychrobium sp. 1_MG-2023 TaxID=3062624 RepID=UPI00273307A5|nr:response regulator transcription factor [Psychrobium sp. 1_MG-2023]MDP2560769.1 response regulator transcription factor [Psychrobium sp. 1_MG-2023]